MNIDPDKLSQLFEDANIEVIKQDREMYDPFFIEFEETVIERGYTYTLLSAVYALTNTGGEKPRYNNYNLTICVDNPGIVTREICDRLMKVTSKHVPERSVYYMIGSDGYTIFINVRPCFKITRVPMFRGKSVDSLVGQMTGIGLWTGKKVLCQNVYSLVSYLLSLTYDFREIIPKEVTVRMVSMLIPEVEKLGAADKKKKVSDSAKILEYVSRHKLVYRVHSRGMPTFVLDATIDIIRKELEAMYTIKIASYDLHDLDDFALIKYIIHDSDGRAVCVIFNSLEHQIVPILKGRFTSRRFSARLKLLEIQMLKMMNSIGHLEGSIKTIIKGVLNEFVALVTSPEFYDEPDIIGYAGNSINWNVLRKNKSKNKAFIAVYPDANGKFISE